MQKKPIRNALISVHDKTGLEEVIKFLHNAGVNMFSTGGTADFIRKYGFSVTTIEELTRYPDLFEGRVKTLHPIIFGGILMNRETNTHVEQARTFSIPPIDLVIVDLYPFQQTVNRTDDHDEIIENIDIGGVALIRAAAKNYRDVFVIPGKQFFSEALSILRNQNTTTSLEQRKRFATYAFQVTSFYDHCIFEYLNKSEISEEFRIIKNHIQYLRYGENPHQKGRFFGSYDNIFTQLNGKEISFNNLLDIEAAWECLMQFEQPACVIVKHTNPCGVAVRDTIFEAWQAALQSDPISAFGGIIACNRTIDAQTAQAINQIFFEILAAPAFDPEAIDLLKSRKNRIILQMQTHALPSYTFRQCFDGVLWQEKDISPILPDEWSLVTKESVPDELLKQMVFGVQVVRHTKSNAIVICGNFMLYGSGMGQVSRLDATKLAIEKARQFSHPLDNAILASDGFFPFTDAIDYARQHGIKYFIQPGGSIKDEEIIQFCNEHGLAMIFTHKRHFKH